jgi:outer membrane protein assembly factor BamB
MHPFLPSRRTALALLACLPMLTLAAADWPSYRGPEGNGRTAEKLPVAWPAGGPKVLWKVASPGGFGSFAVAGGQAFCLELREANGAEQEVLVARDAASGKEAWALPLGTMKIHDGGDDGTSDNKGGDGPRSTPAVAGGKVYVFSQRLVLTCVDAATGKEVWKHDLVKEFEGRNISWMNAQSPVIEDGLVLVAGGGPNQTLLAFQAADGQVAWKGHTDTITHATPVVATLGGQRQAVFFLKSGLLAVEPKTGKELWRYAFPFKVSTAASPVVAGDIVYCSAGYGVGGGAARVIKKGDGWEATEIYRKPGNNPLANHWSTPVLHEGHLYGMFQFKEYGSGPVKCVDVATGDVKWTQPGFGPGHVIGSGNQVLALTDAGELVVFAASPKAYQEVGRADVLAGKCWTTPVLAGGRVYARSTKEAVCLDLGK